MDLNDILGQGGHTKRPEHPDMDRIIEISVQMLADMSENTGSPAEQERLWRKRVDDCVDYDSLRYKAIQEGISLFGIETSRDWQAMVNDPERVTNYVRCLQAFFDGFLIGSQFEQRGGKR